MRKGKDISGHRFGKIIAIDIHHNDKWRINWYSCICDCGNEVIVSSARLRKGETRSCGCLHHPDRTEINCDYCGEKSLRKKSDIKEGLMFCNMECKANWQKDHLTGSCGYNWKGGVTEKYSQPIRRSVEYSNWRIKIFERDNYICRKCSNAKKCSGHLNAHHIANFASIYKEADEILFDIDNGITFCEDCHKEFHEQYGRKNNTQEQINEFLKTKKNSWDLLHT